MRLSLFGLGMFLLLLVRAWRVWVVRAHLPSPRQNPVGEDTLVLVQRLHPWQPKQRSETSSHKILTTGIAWGNPFPILRLTHLCPTLPRQNIDPLLPFSSFLIDIPQILLTPLLFETALFTAYLVCLAAHIAADLRELTWTCFLHSSTDWPSSSEGDEQSERKRIFNQGSHGGGVANSDLNIQYEINTTTIATLTPTKQAILASLNTTQAHR